MNKKKGTVLLQVMISSAVLFIAASMLIKWSLQSTLNRSKAAKSIRGLAGLEAVRAQMWGCLNDRGYTEGSLIPSSGSCTPTAPQAQCVPPDVAADFSGTPPECVLTLSIER